MESRLRFEEESLVSETRTSWTTTNYESFLSLFDDDDMDYGHSLCEVGAPRILKFRPSLIRSQVLRPFEDLKPTNLSKVEKFFHKSLNDYIKAGDVCEFCQSATIKWSERTGLREEVGLKIF